MFWKYIKLHTNKAICLYRHYPTGFWTYMKLHINKTEPLALDVTSIVLDIKLSTNKK